MLLSLSLREREDYFFLNSHQILGRYRRRKRKRWEKEVGADGSFRSFSRHVTLVGLALSGIVRRVTAVIIHPEGLSTRICTLIRERRRSSLLVSSKRRNNPARRSNRSLTSRYTRLSFSERITNEMVKSELTQAYIIRRSDPPYNGYRSRLLN